MASQLDSLDELFVNAQKKDYINSKLRKWSTVDSPKKSENVQQAQQRRQKRQQNDAKLPKENKLLDFHNLA